MFALRAIYFFVSLLLIIYISPIHAAPSPVIDLHLHAGPSGTSSKWYSVGKDETTDGAQTRYLLETFKAHSIVKGVIGGPPSDVERIRSADPSRLIGSVAFPCSKGLDPNLFPCFENGGNWPEVDWLRTEVEAGRIGAIGELYNVYAGVAPDDPRMRPYYELAAQYDLMVLVHADVGPPPERRVAGCCEAFNGDFARPELYEPILARHPQLRLVLYHAFRPDFVQQAIALLDKYPNVMVETSPMMSVPKPLVYGALKAFIEAGHEDRIVFGSDFWGAIAGSIEVIESAPFLTDKQKHGILHDNAAKWLR
ncbi:MAG: amidohydrolase family protein [Aliiglaciecola sp.]|uniref:amidohydrolase family protein n=1 Tax=Aliiglaciecola sp. TaxID=1872441 RepID=UPI003299C08B